MKLLAALTFTALIGWRVNPPPQSALDARICFFGEGFWPCERYVPPAPKRPAPCPTPAPIPKPIEPGSGDETPR